MTKKYITSAIMLVVITGLILYINNESPIADRNKISPQEVKQKIDENYNMQIIDVRTKEEYLTGHIPNSILIPVDELRVKIHESVPDKEQKIILYCRSGNRSQSAMKILIELGYNNVYDLGGINDWPYDIEK
ncbi:hypothetical protein SYNTR_0760 [Candidatus Syntrophocurvum alkaliphilum]|uniref:Rhodanese domain-containing protein n=1 Tax=Candidatus Syntrophocurvum alkaliphilum TaxID=2293317 RepID=A0A6I6DG63_9FIRM|nr:rhodanese-like domain-containing protein [Candidatus Syntrophocurvum alkaliphilum]QGT99353.1 hypothetical protein SYNTR_0760 [Candidatus Syntrophocurvum alkaliphilum]